MAKLTKTTKKTLTGKKTKTTLKTGKSSQTKGFKGLTGVQKRSSSKH